MFNTLEPQDDFRSHFCSSPFRTSAQAFFFMSALLLQSGHCHLHCPSCGVGLFVATSLLAKKAEEPFPEEATDAQVLQKPPDGVQEQLEDLKTKQEKLFDKLDHRIEALFDEALAPLSSGSGDVVPMQPMHPPPEELHRRALEPTPPSVPPPKRLLHELYRTKPKMGSGVAKAPAQKQQRIDN